jgi:hypothetical protein
MYLEATNNICLETADVHNEDILSNRSTTYLDYKRKEDGSQSPTKNNRIHVKQMRNKQNMYLHTCVHL